MDLPAQEGLVDEAKPRVRRGAAGAGAGRAGGPGVVYTLHCRADTGEAVRFFYNPHTSELIDEDGDPAIPDAAPGKFKEHARVSPGAPGRKSSAPETLKIQLGLRCNYSCSYCGQSSEVESATVTKTADADVFLAHLDEWLTGAPARIEFWGGEPFLYFAKLKRLVPELERRFPDAELVIVTNGSLIDDEIIEFIERHDLLIAVSHDGPGQRLRGPDPFEDPRRAAWLRELWRRRGPKGRMTFNVVFTGANSDVGETRAWFVDRIGDEKVALSTEGVVTVYDGATLRDSGRLTGEQHRRLHASIVELFRAGNGHHYENIQHRAEDFLDSLCERRPSSALGQKCGMDREEELAVDLAGNVMTCQNTGAGGKHGLGSVFDLDGVRLDTAWHWSHRECCNYCPVLQLCKGACMYLEGDLFAQSCENEYHYNTAILAGVVKQATGLELVRVEGDIRRPKRARTIPIKPVAADRAAAGSG
jgi:uncharacterized protein